MLRGRLRGVRGEGTPFLEFGARLDAGARRESGPEKRVAVERCFVRPEPDFVGERANGCPEDLRVHLLLGRELLERNAVQRLERVRPVGESRLL